MMLLESDIHYIPYKSIKGRAVLDFLADLPMEDRREETIDFPNEEVRQLELGFK